MRALLLLTAIASGCGSPAAPDGGVDAASARDAEPLAVDAGRPERCPDSLDSTVCSGVVDPTSLDDAIEPVPTGIVPGSQGNHWYCAPSDGAWNGRLLLYLVGTYGDPAADHAFAARACELGLVAIAPMYENRHLVREVCAEDGPCYESFRAEIVDGTPGAPEPIEVAPADSLRNRVDTLLTHLATSQPADFAAAHEAYAAGDFGTVVLAGHSQGAAHALYLARDAAAERVVMLAGPSDRLEDGTPEHAPVPWIAALATTPLQTVLRFAYIHDDDSFQNVPQVVDNWDLAGVARDPCPHASAGGYPSGCRRVHVATDRCAGLPAHAIPILPRWGARCAAGDEHANEATWDHLLTAGAPP